MMHNALDTAHGVVEIMCIGDSVDGMLEELSPDAWSDGGHFDIFEGDAPGLESLCTNLDNGSSDARSVAA
jgi:hypothetical protein